MPGYSLFVLVGVITLLSVLSLPAINILIRPGCCRKLGRFATTVLQCGAIFYVVSEWRILHIYKEAGTAGLQPNAVMFTWLTPAEISQLFAVVTVAGVSMLLLSFVVDWFISTAKRARKRKSQTT